MTSLEEKEDNKFTWGDAITVIKNAPTEFHSGEFGSVCGFDKATSEDLSEELQCSIGDWVYIIEFEDGSDIQIAECYLEPYQKEMS